MRTKRSFAIVLPLGLMLAVTVALAPWGSEATDNAQVANSPPSSASNEPVLQIYPSTEGDIQAVAAQLTKQYAGNPNFRVVPDLRRSQLLILAPPGVHAQLTARLGKGFAAGPDAQPAPRHSAAARASEPMVQKTFKVTHAAAGPFEAALVGSLGNRLMPSAGSSADISAYTLRLADGQSLEISVNRRTTEVGIRGAESAVNGATRLIQALDQADTPKGRAMRLVALRAAQMADVQPAIEALAPQGPNQPLAAEPGAENSSELIGPVQVEMLDGLDVLILRGDPRDVEKVAKIIEQIEQLSAETKPAIDIVPLTHVDSTALATLLDQLYDEVFLARQGSVSITALVKPNALLVVGRPENVTTVSDLIKRLDQPVPPTAQFQVFRLKNASAETAQATVDAFLSQTAQATTTGQRAPAPSASQQGTQDGLSPRGQVYSDFRTNSLIVRACPRDLAEVAALVARIDATTNDAVNEVRVFKLRNSLASDLAPVLQDAITGQMYGQRSQQAPGSQAAVTGQRQDFERKSVRLRFVTIDPLGRGVLNSGILTDAQVTADTRTNSLVVTASAESMPLIAALVDELDQLPSVEAQIKVFTLVNSDATSMMTTLQTMFGLTTGAQTGFQGTGDAPAVRVGTGEGESTLASLRFAVDARTNSIIASGSMGQLTVVEAILLRLDSSDVRNRQSVVVRLKNSPALDVANAINQYLRSERQVEQVAPGLLSAFEQIEREVVVVPEPVSNSLIISATPRFFEEITNLVKQLDERPPMVMIQVLIAEVVLNNTDEFGVELGLQDSILFDRSVAGAGTLAGTSVPGFLFNNTGPLGNSNSAAQNPALVGGQGLSNLGMGRLNGELGFGGLVMSASSESVSVLVRALKECRRLDVLSRPQIMTMDNQTAEILVGQDVPTITATQFTDLGGQINSISYREVGLILTVTPRISPDRLVVMEIDATNSEVGPEAEGIPVSVSQGQVIRSPRINIISARTVVSACNGQTVVLGGLLTKTNTRVTRKVPLLGDVPVLGHLFRYDGEKQHKSELLIIMTPRIVYSEVDAERIKQIETARMDWCLADVIDMHGVTNLNSRGSLGLEGGAVIYPDDDPTLSTMPPVGPNPAPGSVPLPEEMVPSPPPLPFAPETGPNPPPPGAIPAPGASPLRDGASAEPRPANPVRSTGTQVRITASGQPNHERRPAR